jgi:hypothetical protein
LTFTQLLTDIDYFAAIPTTGSLPFSSPATPVGASPVGTATASAASHGGTPLLATVTKPAITAAPTVAPASSGTAAHGLSNFGRPAGFYEWSAPGSGTSQTSADLSDQTDLDRARLVDLALLSLDA